MALKYIIIDKMIINEGSIFNFDLFMPSESEKSIEPFKEKGTLITIEDEKKSKQKKSLLYISENEKLNYEEFYKSYLSSLKTVDRNTTVNIEDASKRMYSHAAQVMGKLFDGHITPQSYDDCKRVVGEFIGVMFDEGYTIKVLNNSIALKYTTSTHSLNVLMYSLCLGKKLKMSRGELEELGEAALLFDIGKSKIEDSILNKKERLAPFEVTIIRKHPDLGVKIAQKIGIENTNILSAIKYHHEKIDGTGYPSKLKGKDIPYFARIIGLCDIFDALTTKRSYADAMSTFGALKYIKYEMGSQIDLEILNKLVLMFK